MNNIPTVGSIVRITGGLLMAPDGKGIGYDVPGPISKEFVGTLGVLDNQLPENGLNILEGVHYPFEPWKSRILVRKARKALKTPRFIRIIEGPLEDTILNIDALDWNILTPLEALAYQI